MLTSTGLKNEQKVEEEEEEEEEEKHFIFGLISVIQKVLGEKCSLYSRGCL